MLKYVVMYQDEVIVEIPEDKFIAGLIEYSNGSDIETAFKRLKKDLEAGVRRI